MCNLSHEVCADTETAEDLPYPEKLLYRCSADKRCSTGERIRWGYEIFNSHIIASDSLALGSRILWQLSV